MNETKQPKTIRLLVIDPQNDFCDIPGAAPALPVPGAHQDMLRLAEFINRVSLQLTSIHVTLDSHHPLHIAHPLWFVNRKHEHPAPFTEISEAAFAAGEWTTTDPAKAKYTKQYLQALTAGGRYAHRIWPEHCLIGSWGHNVHSRVFDALNRWGRTRLEAVDYIWKGSNPYTEQFSAVKAEVPVDDDQATLSNPKLTMLPHHCDMLVLSGEALSHCVASTVRDIAGGLEDKDVAKLVLLTDCASSVGGLEFLSEQFVQDLSARGMKLAKSTELFA